MRERKIKRLVADIISGIGRQAAAQACAAKCCFDLAIGKSGTLDLRRAGKNRMSMRACARDVEVKPAHPVQRPRFDAETFAARRETEMQNGVRLQRFFKLLKSWPNSRIINWQHRTLEFYAEACQSRSMGAKRSDERV